MIERTDWRWRGMPGHLIVSSSCCFHMVTEIGEIRVSTIGCYHSPMNAEERSYENRTPLGAGDDSLYETMLFVVKDGKVTEWGELASERYGEESDAETGHMRFCEEVAQVDGDPERVREASE